MPSVFAASASTFECFTESTNVAEAMAGRCRLRAAAVAFPEQLRQVALSFETLLGAGVRTHGTEAIQWVPPRYSGGVDHLTKMVPRGSSPTLRT